MANLCGVLLLVQAGGELFDFLVSLSNRLLQLLKLSPTVILLPCFVIQHQRLSDKYELVVLPLMGFCAAAASEKSK